MYGWIYLVFKKAQLVPESLGSWEPLRGIWGCVRAQEAVTKTRFVRGSPADGSELTLSAFTEPYDSCAESRRMAIIRWCFWHGRIEVGERSCALSVFSKKPWNPQSISAPYEMWIMLMIQARIFFSAKNSCLLLYEEWKYSTC